ncbi:MAG: alanine--tRNA ligase [Patescibacteria group bacterium]|nr:alanine--tRNA ligase [Patescibacteria group bacterium]
MTTDQIKKAYLDFFTNKKHAVIPPAPLIPQDDPTTLFNNSGMQQLVPYLKGEPHPMGKRLVDSQPCFRAEDIDEVGDNRHTTYFEMLGNWSLGDYFKKEQLAWIWEFLTNILKLPKEKLFISVFKGDKNIRKDEESIKIWKSLGIKDNHIFQYPAEKNWWSRAGTPDKMPTGEIGGPDSEIFYDFGKEYNFHEKSEYKDKKCHLNCDCGRYLEIGNSVFMQYIKTKNNSLKPLPKQNVDFGGGLERLAQAVQKTPDIFQINIFKPIIKSIEKATNKKYQGKNKTPMRIIADHLRSAKAMIDQGLEPSNKQQGYVLRRLIRRSAVKFRQLTGELNSQNFSKIIDEPALIKEINKFQKSLNKGLNLIDRATNKDGSCQKVDAQFAFNLFQTHGFPFEITQEILKSKNIKIKKSDFNKLKKSHSKKSKSASAGMFKGGLEDQSEATTKLHTATHLLHQTLRQILGDHIKQEGSNITAKRLRFDFTHDQALTDDQLKKVENLINKQIKKDLSVTKKIEKLKTAINSGALAFFKENYPDKVTVYSIGDFSKELCGGPHVNSTGEIGGVKIIKQDSIGAGKRRIYVALKNGIKKSAH